MLRKSDWGEEEDERFEPQSILGGSRSPHPSNFVAPCLRSSPRASTFSDSVRGGFNRSSHSLGISERLEQSPRLLDEAPLLVKLQFDFPQEDF